MRFRHCVLVAVCFAMICGGAFADTIIKDDEYSAAEPFVAFDVQGGVLELVLIDRLNAGHIDESTTLLRAAEYANPGLLKSIASEAERRGSAAGIPIGQNMTQADIDQLNELTRRMIADEVRPYLAVVKSQLDAAAVEQIGWTRDLAPSKQAELVARLPRFGKLWYEEQPHPNAGLDETTMCGPCTADCNCNGVICPNQCVEGCDPPARNCDSVSTGGGGTPFGGGTGLVNIGLQPRF